MGLAAATKQIKQKISKRKGVVETLRERHMQAQGQILRHYEEKLQAHLLKTSRQVANSEANTLGKPTPLSESQLAASVSDAELTPAALSGMAKVLSKAFAPITKKVALLTHRVADAKRTLDKEKMRIRPRAIPAMALTVEKQRPKEVQADIKLAEEISADKKKARDALKKAEEAQKVLETAEKEAEARKHRKAMKKP